jgi:hypothetical protein
MQSYFSKPEDVPQSTDVSTNAELLEVVCFVTARLARYFDDDGGLLALRQHVEARVRTHHNRTKVNGQSIAQGREPRSYPIGIKTPMLSVGHGDVKPQLSITDPNVVYPWDGDRQCLVRVSRSRADSF